ncbi:unnamed protein product [Peronospora effusa]|uniref:Uncharacterized protein n=1 Tax=Peronospora effusa TaxID=542832 RepID=A0A3R7WP47_9STRA|nr:hypothetical protein DD237_008213 [Peronospora effusa]CAI5703797.1 unnamed protein product [Peronospora effusa]
MATTNREEEGRRSMQIMPNWTKYTPTVWPPSTDVVPKEPEEGDYLTHREYGAAVHLRSRVIKQWKKNFGLAQRARMLLGKDAVEIGDMPCCKQTVANSIIGLSSLDGP